MEGKVKEEPSSPPSPRRKQKRAESPKSPPPPKESAGQSSAASKCNAETQAALSKVRRLLYTLVQHSEDMGAATADRVKPLIMALVAGSVTLEEFQAALHETTGSPLRPFVVPFLQAYLPILQNDCATQARGRKQGILEYLSCTDSAILERGGSPSFVSEVYGKRRVNERSYEEESLSLKRPLLVHPMASPDHPPPSCTEDQWRNIHVMLNCTLSMVEKTKQALTLLQHSPSRETLEEERMQQTVRLTEERIQQIRKKAEEAITEIKKKAALEIERVAASLKRPRASYPDFF